ncbi:SDR family NAD(P)-dependent oxidoreductase [Aspergillus homomorphus CBS 101889]|uniref:NAD(P)-binding protein n=1 Tax=Aspergillus homomorphus (strain CBS 101889) TaxID=1450537 RepID=A0A395I5V9_ASPHC|nr:NAD(P)-binding protein [Aspergillus homomorphus CBS 101889]RAL15166.1 NAD(P)-binding protein [Aspergillus homomorphus CBS 101889]
MATYRDLTQKVVLIVGGGAGIGKSAALAFAHAGSKVVVADINPGSVHQTVTEIKTSHPQAQTLAVTADISQATEADAMVQKAVAEYGRVDVAVNSAAIPAAIAPIAELDESHWAQLLGVNLTGMAWCLKYQLRQMIQQQKDKSDGQPSIINLASAAGLKAQAFQAAYSTAKHGVIGLTKVAALENGVHGIRVNALAPGATSTDFLRQTLTRMGTCEAEVGPHVGLFGRVASSEEIMQAVLWLASDVSSYVTGVTLPVDAGFTLQ